MAKDHGQPQDIDLDRTDRLPILEGVDLTGDFGDDAVRMDAPGGPVTVDFVRPSSFDLPSLAESVRSVEERIARQNSEYEALNRSFQRSREAETAASTRVTILERDVAGLREALDTEEAKTREQDAAYQALNDSFLKSRDAETVAAGRITVLEKDLTGVRGALDLEQTKTREKDAAYETLNHSFLKSRDAETAATGRITVLEKDLTGVRRALDLEQARTRDQSKAISDKNAAIEAARARAEEALLDSNRHQGESRTLRDTLASREATIAKVSHSLGERDAQLSSLQAEHAKVVPALAAREKSLAKLQSELAATRSQLSAATANLKSERENAAGLAAELKRHAAEITATRSELGSVRTQSTSYMELLSSRAWRAGFDQNMFLELDERAGAADLSREQHAKAEAKVAELSATIEKLQGAAAVQAKTVADQAQTLLQREAANANVSAKLTAVEEQCTRLTADLAAREKTLIEARSAASSEAQRLTELLAAAERGKAEQAAQVSQLRAEHSMTVSSLQSDHAAKLSALQSEHSAKVTGLETEHATQVATMLSENSAKVTTLESEAEAQEQEMAVLMAHLKEARRPIELIEAEVARLNEQMTAKSAQIDSLTEENKKLTAGLERTKGALEEREFLIRRLERSESNNANALGRIQTSMERLGSINPPPPGGQPQLARAPEWQPEFVRIDGDRNISHTLGKRTRIGRASTCELQIDSSSVSRHHALVVVGPREAIIEDLNSTNGVVVNSRKISRHLLVDGDVITLGEIVFKYATKREPVLIEVPAAVPPPAE
jgi:chromosome segregation ATPase